MMRIRRFLQIVGWTVLWTAAVSTQSGVEIILLHGSERETKTKAQLGKILGKYDLSKWMFTRKVIIDENSIPHSHPVLTLNANNLDDDFQLLSEFVHEQLHWFLERNPEATEKAILELRTVYPSVPNRLPEGARDEYSTYLHLLVCHLEYEAMKELVGAERAKQTMEAFSRHHYRWVYRTILTDGSKIEPIVRKYRLTP